MWDGLWALFVVLWPVAAALAIAAVIEMLAPWRPNTSDRTLRWTHGVVLAALSTLLLTLVFPLGHFGIALWVRGEDWALSNVFAPPAWLYVALGVLVIDLFEWIGHWSAHRFAWLWRVHAVHHSDATIDAATAIRFHPFEVCYRYLVVAFAIVALAVPPESVVIYGVVALIFNVWEHANVPIPPLLARLDGIVITPDLHRLHHSTEVAHFNRNFGVVLAIWDRLFGTYLPASALKAETSFGLGAATDAQYATLAGVLGAPLFRPGTTTEETPAVASDQ